jgi:hypothetical protein
MFQVIPCLYSLASGHERQTAGAVEAISYDQSEKVIRSWIGVNLTAVNNYNMSIEKEGVTLLRYFKNIYFSQDTLPFLQKCA